ncbi:MAG: redox-sensing transcriptional repressor Rex [Anaerolineales bacterium]|nr:redox-sensing transcriptional repressor Rex [Anaerolineales bacterium]
MNPSKVPDIVIGRLPLYLRALTQMAQDGKEITSSQELGGELGISSAQIRKDLSQFGEFGKQGTGYNIEFLADQLKRILHLDQIWDVALIGAGDLGTAIANYGGFIDRGFRIRSVYDNDPSKIGTWAGAYEVHSVDQLEKDLRDMGIKIVMLAVPASHAQEVTERLIAADVKAILCYAPISLSVPDSVKVQYIDPVLHLQHMTFYLSK